MNAPQRILCLGEVSWDRSWKVDRLPSGECDVRILETYESSGGCALNTAHCLAARGIPVTIAGNALGDDNEGFAIESELRFARVNSRLQIRQGLKTPICQILVEAQTGRRSFLLNHGSIQACDQKSLASILALAEETSFSHIFVQYYLQEMSMRFLNASSFSNAFIMTQDVEPHCEIVPLVDLVQISISDAEAFDEVSLFVKSKTYFRGRCKALLVTAGGRGAAYCELGKPLLFQPVFACKSVLDTTGCGDAFRAGLMEGFFLKKSLKESLALGSQIASLKAERQGSHL